LANLLFYFCLTFFTQCKKDDSSKESATSPSLTNLQQKTLYSPKVSPNNSEILAKIESFQNKIIELRNNKGLSVRSGDNMKVDDFLWNMEALLNFKYGESDKPFSEIVSKEDVVEIPLNSDGKVNNSDLVAAVESIRRKVGEQWVSVNVTSKHVIGIDLSIEGSNGSSLVTSAKFRIETSVGGGNPVPVSPTMDFGLFDDIESIFFGLNKSSCDKTIVGQDAAHRLSAEINLRFPSYAKYSGFFTSYTGESLQPGNYLAKPSSQFNNDRDFKIFRVSNEYPNYNLDKLCLNSSDMTYYYNNLYEILRQKKQLSSYYSSLSFAYVELMGDLHAHHNEITMEDHTGWQHYGKFRFGVYVLADCQRVCNPEPGIGGGCFYTPCGY
jgi:hypothetical protein